MAVRSGKGAEQAPPDHRGNPQPSGASTGRTENRGHCSVIRAPPVAVPRSLRAQFAQRRGHAHSRKTGRPGSFVRSVMRLQQISGSRRGKQSRRGIVTVTPKQRTHNNLFFLYKFQSDPKTGNPPSARSRPSFQNAVRATRPLSTPDIAAQNRLYDCHWHTVLEEIAHVPKNPDRQSR